MSAVFTFLALIPGELQVNVQNDLLTMRGERKTTRTTKEIELFEREITYGAFERALELPEGVNTEKLAAEYAHGVLEITAPIAAVALPRKIEIKTLPTPKAVAA